ncbi:MAG: hypothetical protein PVH66_03880 [Methyloceanibacter sp.]
MGAWIFAPEDRLRAFAEAVDRLIGTTEAHAETDPAPRDADLLSGQATV